MKVNKIKKWYSFEKFLPVIGKVIIARYKDDEYRFCIGYLAIEKNKPFLLANSDDDVGHFSPQLQHYSQWAYIDLRVKER